MTWKQIISVLSGILLGMASLATVHSAFVVPMIINECRAIVREEIDRHFVAGPHPGAVRSELLDARLSSIETRLERIEDKLDKR